MDQSKNFLQFALLVLWLQLLLTGQFQLFSAIIIPVILFFSTLGTLVNRNSKYWIVVLTLFGWACTISLENWFISLVNLLWLMSGLKILEADSKIDTRNSILVTLLGIGLASILINDLASSLVYIFVISLCLAALLSLELGPQTKINLVGFSFKLLIMLLPLILLFFLFFPRIPALWSFEKNKIGLVGLDSSSLRLGDFSSLVREPGIAARVFFTDEVPKPKDRYWRAIVHTVLEGDEWHRETDMPEMININNKQIITKSEKWLMEPTPIFYRLWSGNGIPLNNIIEITKNGTLLAGKSIQDREMYELYKASGIQQWNQVIPRETDVDYIEGSNPRLEALGQNWKNQYSDTIKIIEVAQEWFKSQSFIYTLSPGEIKGKSKLDTFLFDTQSGFCEHYAVSFSALMRAAGIPSRVVVGYQGGRLLQPFGLNKPYLLINNSDAHAWSEVWIPSIGWKRVDPTTWVAPGRINQPLFLILNDEDRNSLGFKTPDWLVSIADQWQGLDTRWQLSIMQFDESSQKKLLTPIIGDNYQLQTAIALILIGSSLTIIIYFYRIIELREGYKDKERIALDKCLSVLTTLELYPRKGETLKMFIKRASKQLPELKLNLYNILNKYNYYRFDHNSKNSKLLRKSLIKELNRNKKVFLEIVKKYRTNKRK